MRPGKESGGRRRRSSASSSSSSSRTRSSPSALGPSSRLPYPEASLLDREILNEEALGGGEEVLDYSPGYLSRNGYNDSNPRSFPHSVKQQCWEKAEKIKGRDPDRWRRDAVGNVVFREPVGPDCLRHDYDHIVPYSKGGKSTLGNCQVLQAAVNRSKGNRTEISKADLIQKSAYCKVSGQDMDCLERSAYGNVHRGQDADGCRPK